MRRFASTPVILACIVSCAKAPAPATPRVEREVKGQTIISNELPAADLTFSPDFRYLGSQVVTIYEAAEAEQHFFTTLEKSGRVSRFYWVQFEHYLPTNSHTYEYPPERTIEVGGLQFIYDVTAFSNYGGGELDPRSDGAAAASLLAKHNLLPPARMVSVRLFHLPAPDRRSELMIIYGEALPPDSRVPVSDDGVPLDSEAPAEARVFCSTRWRG